MDSLTIERSGAVEQISSALEREILRGEIPPGAPVRESVLAQKLGVSRNTVREAIRGLVPARLVRYVPNRGFLVPELTAPDIVDLFRARESLEVEAIRDRFDAARKIVDRLEAIARQLEDRATLRDWDGAFREDLAFHLEVVRLLGSERLAIFFSDVFAELRLALAQVDRLEDDPGRLAREHRELTRPIRQGDRAGAVRAFRRHLRTAARSLHRSLASPGGDGGERP